MTTLLLTALLSIVPVETVVRDTVDVIEQNFFYDEQGRLVFEQLIYIDENDDVIAWRMAKGGDIRPQYDHRTGEYVCLWWDDINFSGLRLVRSNHMRTTWTQHDPELAAREKLPQEQRRGFRKR